MEHVFNIHDTLEENMIEFCKFYLQGDSLVVEMARETKKGGISWVEFHNEILPQYGPDELEDPRIALANLDQTGTIQAYYKSFIKLDHLVDETEKNLISIFLAG